MLYDTFLAAIGGAGFTSCNKKIFNLFIKKQYYDVIPMERKRRGILARRTTQRAVLAANKISFVRNDKYELPISPIIPLYNKNNC